MHRLRAICKLKQQWIVQSKPHDGQMLPIFQMWGRKMSQNPMTASCVYRNGLVVLTLPLPSREENCEFLLRPVTHTIKDLATHAHDEDAGIDRFALYSTEGARISNATPIDILMQQDFKVVINDKTYDIDTPKPEQFPAILDDQLSNTKNLITQLYSDLNAQEYNDNQERAIRVRLDSLRNDLSPLEEQKAIVDSKAAQRTNFLVWSGLGYMALQFGFLARLTWWEYSWDIMEPVTYFVTYLTSMVCYGYFVLTRQDCTYPEVKSRSHLFSFYRESDKIKFDVDEYNAKKELVAKLETELKSLKTPPVLSVDKSNE